MYLDSIQDLKAGFVGASGVEKIAIAKRVLSERKGNIKPQWATYQDSKVLRIGDYPVIAIPHTGKENSRKFDVVDIDKKELIASIDTKKDGSVITWLSEYYKAQMESNVDDDYEENEGYVYPDLTAEQIELSRLDAVNDAKKVKEYLENGGTLRFYTQTKGTILNNPAQIKIAKDGLYVTSGKKFDYLMPHEVKQQLIAQIEKNPIKIRGDNSVLDSAANQLREQLTATKSGLEAFDLLSSLLSEKPTKQAEQSAIFGDDDLNPNSPNYRYRDTGYIAGSKKELAAIAAEMIKKASKDGDLVRASSIDFDSIENNPREAKMLITKSNLLGKIDWQKHKDSGMSPAAAFLIDRVLFAIPKEPASDTAQARHDYAIGIETLRDRLELCKTPNDVLRLIDEVREEWAGTVLSADESEQYKTLYADYLEKYNTWADATKALRDAEYPLNKTLTSIEFYDRNLASAKRGRDPFGKYFKSEADKQEIINGCIEKITELQALKETQQNEINAYKAAHPQISEKINFTYSDGKDSGLLSELDFIAEDAKRKADAIKKTAELRNKAEGYSNQATRSWQSFGDGFKKLLKYRYRGNSKSFFDHANNALGGKPDNWDWAIKAEKPKDTETDTPEEKKKRTQFQLKVSDSYERVGGREVNVKSTLELKNLFGLRDVQSGNYVLNDKSSIAGIK